MSGHVVDKLITKETSHVFVLFRVFITLTMANLDKAVKPGAKGLVSVSLRLLNGRYFCDPATEPIKHGDGPLHILKPWHRIT